MSTPFLHQSSWASSALGSAIELYSSADKSRAPLLMIGGVHGDEPEGVRLATDLLDWLHKNHKKLRPWILIPCLNVDGYKKNERTNGAGVDLNRNFPSPDWSSEHSKPRYFPGSTPGSEPEVKAVVQLIQERKPDLIVHFHSWEPCVVYTGSPGRKAAEILGRDTPYKVSESIGYPTPGSL